MFEDDGIEQRFAEEVLKNCAGRGVPEGVLKAAGGSPYSRWTRAHRWMLKHEQDRLATNRLYHAITRIAIVYEMEAAKSVKLFDGVYPVLEQLQFAGIPVVIVSNNATAAVELVLEKNDAKRLVDHVVGREFNDKMIGILKPKPNLVVTALKRAGHDAGTALLVGDSVDDMRAGRKAKIRRRVALLEHSTATKLQLRRAGAKRILRTFGELPDLPELRRVLHNADASAGR